VVSRVAGIEAREAVADKEAVEAGTGVPWAVWAEARV